jgi:hypothetical protein
VNGRLCGGAAVRGPRWIKLASSGVVHDGQSRVPLELDAEALVGAEVPVGAAFEL